MPFMRIGIRDKVTGATTVALSETGKRLAERFDTRGVNFAILSALNEKSPQSISELAIETQIEISETKQRVKLLAKQGYIRMTGIEA